MISVIILSRERDFETGEFGLEFSLGGLGDERQSTSVFSAILELMVTKTGLIFDKSSPTFFDFRRFSRHSN